MNYLEHIAEQETEGRRFLNEYTLQGKFDEALQGFNAVEHQLYRVPSDIDAEIYVPCEMALAAVNREQGFTRLRRILHNRVSRDLQPDTEASDNISAAYEDLDTAYDRTAEWIEFAGDYPTDKMGKLLAVHGLTLSCLARVDAARLAARTQGRAIDEGYGDYHDVLGREGSSVERARSFFVTADEYLGGSNDTYGATINAVRAALLERGVGGDAKSQASWLRIAGEYAMDGVAVESDEQDRIRAAEVLEVVGQAVDSQDAAIGYMTYWRTV